MSDPNDKPDPNKPDLADRLLSLPRPAESKLARYRKETAMLIEREQKALRRERLVAAGLWIFAVVLAAAWTVGASSLPLTPARVWVGLMFVALLIWGSAELLKSFINRARVDLLKEIKEAELRLLEAIEAKKAGG
jgi:hypothetical protein